MSRSKIAASLVAGMLVILSMTGCGRSSTPQPVTAGAPATAPRPGVAPAPEAAPGLPTLPPIREREPELFDENGCRRVTAEQSSCASTGAQIDAATAEAGADGTRTLTGFAGKHWSVDPPDGSVSVIEETVKVRAGGDGHWHALGLVRNQTSQSIAGASVTAELVGRDGTVLEKVEGGASVPVLRSGEPSPFDMTADRTLASDVSAVRWSAAALPGSADTASRNVELRTFWTRAPDDPRRVEVGTYRDPESAPFPFLLFGSLTNLATEDLGRPSVWLAWFDAEGRVAAVQHVVGTDNRGPVSAMPVGVSADFLAVLEPPSFADMAPEQLATPSMWGAAS